MKEFRHLVDISKQLIQNFDAISAARARTKEISEIDIPVRKFPWKYNKNLPGWNKYEWDEKEVREFFQDSENRSRIIYCPEINRDMTDSWGMFGYEPGFIFIEEKRYSGNKTFSDEAASLDLTIKPDPILGIYVTPHFDFFPSNKYSYELIRQSDEVEMFTLLSDIFLKPLRIDGVDNDNRSLPPSV